MFYLFDIAFPYSFSFRPNLTSCLIIRLFYLLTHRHLFSSKMQFWLCPEPAMQLPKNNARFEDLYSTENFKYAIMLIAAAK